MTSELISALRRRFSEMDIHMALLSAQGGRTLTPTGVAWSAAYRKAGGQRAILGMRLNQAIATESSFAPDQQRARESADSWRLEARRCLGMDRAT